MQRANPAWPVLVALGAALTACSASEPGSSEAPTGILSIESHEDGDTVNSDSIQVRGTAPAGAEVVLDISFGRDKRTSADADGSWVLTVDLDEGENDLTFRIGDDESTSKTIRVIYDASLAAGPSEEASPDEAESAEPTPEEPTPPPTPAATPAPTPVPTPVVATFGSGDLIVGEDVQPGTYRTRTAAAFCYWERLSGFGGTLDDIIANGTGEGYFVVSIAPTDAGFSSDGCGSWSADLSGIKDPGAPITEDGVYIVGADIAPGTWRSSGGSEFGCYAARLSGFGGTLDEVITNDIATEGGLVINIAPTDVGFETTGCGTWEKIG